MAKRKYQKRNDGRFETKVWDGHFLSNGRKHYISLYSDKSSADLEKRVNVFRKAVEERKIIRSSSMSFFEYSKEWLEVYKFNSSEGTKAMYRNIIDRHLNGLKSVSINEVDKIHLIMILNGTKGNLRTQNQIYMTFKQIIKAAISDRLMPAALLADIFEQVPVPRYKAPERRTLTEIEKHAIFAADFSDMERAFVYLLYGCGMRRGEVLALTRFDFKNGCVTVNKSLAFKGNDAYLKEPKTKNSFRTIPLAATVAPFINVYLSTKDGNLFTTSKGEMITLSSYTKLWNRILKKMNLAAGGTDSLKVINGLTAHIFRHNYCSNLCYQIPKISIKKIAELLGDTESMVLNVYNHVILSKENAAEAVNIALAI
jgi:integrase